MKSRSLASLFLVAALAAAAVNVRAADAAAKPDKPVPADMQKAIDQFNTKRDAMIANRQALFEQLKGKTAEEKKAILDSMQAQQKDLLDAQRALGRQIRDELRKLRHGLPAGGTR